MYNIDKTGLVLEGGGMRGIFTIGVLDAFMEGGLRFPYVIGVSAGACNGCSYVTGQQGRARFSNVGLVERCGHEYLGLRLLLTTGNIFNVKLLYDDLPNRLWPFDYDTYFNTPTEFEIVTTNLRSGKAEYFSNHFHLFRELPEAEARKLALTIILASSSLPYVSKTVDVLGIPMLDGGVVDSIPVVRAMSKGYRNNVVILTRNKGFRKKPSKGPAVDMLSASLRTARYKQYPAFRDAMHNREALYNEQLALVERLEDEGKVLVIRPEKPIEVDRIERDTDKLNALYEEGLAIGRRFVSDFLAGQKSSVSGTDA